MSKKRSPITARLWNEGKTIPQWAAEHGFKARNVEAVIYGHNKGHHGTAEKIAIALGIKEQPK